MTPIEQPDAPVKIGEKVEYWVTEQEPDKLADHARDRVDDFIEKMKKSRFWANASRNWNYYHGLFTGKGLSASDAAIEVMGRDGQLRQISLNHFHELIGHMLNLVTQNRPAFETEATRTDHDAIKNAELGDAVINDYLFICVDSGCNRVTEYFGYCGPYVVFERFGDFFYVVPIRDETSFKYPVSMFGYI